MHAFASNITIWLFAEDFLTFLNEKKSTNLFKNSLFYVRLSIEI